MTVLSIIVDLVIAGLPIIFLRKLQINRRTKFGLCLLMGLGVMCIPLFTHPLFIYKHELTVALLSTAICCAVRTVLSAGATTDPDSTWAISANIAWRLPEVNIGIVCANAPIFRPLYLYFRGRLATQIRDKTREETVNQTALSKGRLWPQNAQNANIKPNGSGIRSEAWGSEDTTVELEMGLPVQKLGGNRRSSSPLREDGIVKEKTFFTFSNKS